MNSQIPKFYQLSKKDRINTLIQANWLDDNDKSKLEQLLNDDIAGSIVENQIGQFVLPEGVALNFIIDGKDYIVPMVTEEPSVIAACSHAAKLCRTLGGFTTTYNKRQMMGQIIVNNLQNVNLAKQIIDDNKNDLVLLANNAHPSIVKRGGGLTNIETKTFNNEFLTIYLTVDTKEAMGANIINTILEALKEKVITLINGEIVMAILSNYPKETLTKVECKIPFSNLGKTNEEGKLIAKKIEAATNYANFDIHRLTTHIKGILNGIEAVTLATGNDTRAITSAVYAHTFESGTLKSPTTWKVQNNCLHGTIEVPIPVGSVGGAINVLNMAQLNLKLLQNPTAKELSSIIASVGLAQNLAALKALVSEGIQRGHMALHAKNLAIWAGAKGDMIDIIAKQLQEENNFSKTRANEILENNYKKIKIK